MSNILNELNLTAQDYAVIKDPKFLKLGKMLKLENKDLTTWEEFNGIHFVRFQDWDVQKNIKKPVSRSAFGALRDPFEVKPEMQAALDLAKAKGIQVDDNIEQFVLQGSMTLLPETMLSVKNLKDGQLVWAGRSLKVAHPKGYTYGEIDELLYNPLTEEYHVADTKTSSSVKKAGYYYQLATYVQVLRELNPDKKISDIAYINWVKYDTEKWEMDNNWESKYVAQYGPVPEGEEVGPDHPIYNAKFVRRVPLDQPRVKQELVKIDLSQDFGVCPNVLFKLIQNDWFFMHSLVPKFGLHGSIGYDADNGGYRGGVEKFLENINQHDELKRYNEVQQQTYNNVKDYVEGGNKW